MRRNIIKPAPPPPPKNPKRIAALKAHLTRHTVRYDRWLKKLKRAANEVAKHNAKVRYYQNQLDKENES